MRKIYNYKIGDIVDDLKIVEIIPPIKGSGTSVKYKTICQVCGREKLIDGHRLHKHNGTTHRACGKGLKLQNPRFYRIWQNMRTRTTNEKYCHYKDYGGRGISSDEFSNFIDFYDKMFDEYQSNGQLYGESNISLERIDVNGNYSSINCTWIPISEQHSNTRKTVYFEIQFPDGHNEIHKNINQFARTNKLNVSSLTDLINGRLKTYKGFKGHRINKKCND